METSLSTQRTNEGDYQLVARGTSDDMLIAMWLHAGKVGENAGSQAQYRHAVDAFMAFVGVPLQECRLDDLQAFRDSLRSQYAASTQAQRIAAVKALFTFAQRVGYIRVNPAVMVQTPRAARTAHRRTVSPGGIERMRDACQTDGEYALVHVLYDSAARISEVLALTWQDVTPRADGKGAVLHILHGKGDKQRDVGIREDAYQALLSIREDAPATAFVFRTRTGQPWQRNHAHRVIKRVCRHAGVSEDVSCHWLRHSHATHSIAAGGNVADLQAQLGHASLSTTTQYVAAQAYSSDKLPV